MELDCVMQLIVLNCVNNWQNVILSYLIVNQYIEHIYLTTATGHV